MNVVQMPNFLPPSSRAELPTVPSDRAQHAAKWATNPDLDGIGSVRSFSSWILTSPVDWNWRHGAVRAATAAADIAFRLDDGADGQTAVIA